MTCQEVLDLLYDVLDNEVSEADVIKIREHLSACGHCSGVYKLERAVDNLLKEKLSKESTPASVDTLKAKVLTELDAIDLEKKSACLRETTPVTDVKRQPALRLGGLIAIAASVIVILGAVFYTSKVNNHHEVYSPLEKAHLQVTKHLDGKDHGDEVAAARKITAQVASYEVYPSVEDFELINAHMDNIEGLEIPHFVYKSGNGIVSVFIVSADNFDIPQELLSNPVTRHQMKFFDHICPGCRLVYHQEGNNIIITATSDPKIELLDFIPGKSIV